MVTRQRLTFERSGVLLIIGILKWFYAVNACL